MGSAPNCVVPRLRLTAPGETSGASKINQRGWVLASTDGRPFVWNPRNDATVALRIPQGGAPFPFDLNDRGYVVGLRFEGDISHILIWASAQQRPERGEESHAPRSAGTHTRMSCA
jgi:hypothetical protein